MKTRLLILLFCSSFTLFAQNNKNRALIIGVSEYKELPAHLQLQYADDDALEFYKFLKTNGAGNIDTTNIKLLLNQQATAGQIYSALDELIDVTKANDKVIIYFSGHGDIETKTVRQRGFLLAHDSPRAGYQVGGTVKLSDLQDYLETLVTVNKARVILITDACRSGKLAGGDVGAAQTTAVLNEQWGSIIKILSSQAGELSGESSEWGSGHGVFTYNLINGLIGLADTDKDGYVSLTELNIFLSTEVPKATFDSQHPVVSGNLGSKMSKVDPVKLSALVAKKNAGKPDDVLLASNKGNFPGLDTLSKRLYGNFQAAIKKGELLRPANTNAFVYFRKLAKLNNTNVPFQNEMKRVLVASVEDNLQKVLNRYMKQDRSITDDEYLFARMELDSALTLIPKNYTRSNSLYAKRYFLEADLIECTCDPSAVGDEEARKSLQILRKAIALQPETAYLHNSLGNAYFFLDKYDSAIASYNIAHALAPSWVYPINNLGTAYREMKQNDKAIEYYKQSIKVAPDHFWAYDMLRITASHRLKKPELAVAAGVDQARHNPTPITLAALASNYAFMDDNESALRIYNKILQMDSTNAEALSRIAAIITSSDYDGNKYNHDDAIGFLDRAAASFKRNPGRSNYFHHLTLYDIADTYSNADNGDDKAAQLFQEALAANPTDKDGLTQLASFYSSIGESEKAMEMYKRISLLYPTAEYGYIGLAYQYLYVKKDADRAIENFSKGIHYDSTEEDYFNARGLAYLKKGKNPEAIRDFNKAIDLYPYFGEAYLGRATAYAKSKKYNEAIQDLAKGIELDGKLEDYVDLKNTIAKKNKAWSAFLEGRMYEDKNQDDKAKTSYQKAISLNTKLTPSYIALADLLDERKDEIALYEKGVKQNPNWAEGLYALALLYDKRDEDGDELKAIEFLERAAKIDPKLDEVFETLGDFYHYADQNQKSLDSFLKAYQTDSTDAGVVDDIAQQYKRLKDYPNAIRYYELAAELRPMSAVAVTSIGDAYFEKGDTTKAITWYNKAHARDSIYFLSVSKDEDTENADEYLEINGRYAMFAALRASNEAGNENPVMALYWLEAAAKLGFDISEPGEYGSLPNDPRFQKLLSRYPGYEQLIKEGDDFRANKKTDAAIDRYKKAVQFNRKGYRALIRLGSLYREKKEMLQADEYFEKAVMVASGDSYNSSLVSAGDELRVINEYDFAIKCYNKSIAAGGSSAVYSLVQLYKDKSDYEKAIETYRRALQKDPSFIYYKFSIGDLYREQKLYDKALDAYQQINVENPGDGEAYLYMGDLYQYYMDKKDYEKALEYYNKGLSIDSTLAMAYYKIGQVYDKLRNPDKALEYYERTTRYYKDQRLYLGKRGSYMSNFAQPYFALAPLYGKKNDNARQAISYARAYWLTGNRNEVLKHLETAAKAGWDIASDPVFSVGLKDDAGYKKLVAQYPGK